MSDEYATMVDSWAALGVGALAAEPSPRDGALEPAPVVGERRQVGGNRPFLVAGDQIWFVERGAVDLFSVGLRDGEAQGARRHFARIPAGGVVVGLGFGGRKQARGLLAVAMSGSVLSRAPVAALALALGDTQRSPALRAVLDGWIAILCAAVTPEVHPKGCIELDPGKELSVRQAISFRSRSPVAWVRPLAGRITLLGEQALSLDGAHFTPVARPAWLETGGPARLALKTTAELPDAGALVAGLEALHTLVLGFANRRSEALERAEGERMQRRSDEGRSVLARACRRLAGAVRSETMAEDEGAPLDDPGTESDTLLAAARTVARPLGLTIKGPAEGERGGAASERDPLAAILRSSRLRARKVALRDEWWQADNGPLLAWSGEGAAARPVALLRARQGYTLRDPLERADTVVDAAVAAGLGPFAYTFYRPFPNVALGIRGLVRFGARGCTRDVLLTVALGLAVSLLGMVPSFATGVLFNNVIPGAQRSELLHLTLLLVVAALASALFGVCRGIAVLRMQNRIGASVQAAVWDRLLRLPLSFFRPYTAGDLATRAMSIDGIQQVLSGSTVSAIMGGIFSLANLVLMFFYSATLAGWALLLIAIAVGVTAAGSALQLGSQRGALAQQARTSGVVLQLLTSIAKLRTAGCEMRAFALWVEQFSKQRRLQLQASKIANWIEAFNAAFPVAAYLVIYWAAAPLLASGSALRTGDFLAFGSAFSSCLGSMLSTCTALLGTLTTLPLYEQARPILTSLPEVSGGRSDPGQLTGDIVIQHAVFRYQTDGPLILRDLSLQIKAGEFVAFAGPSGSGKSTLFRLLLGFETLESGSIYYDGQEIGGLDIQAVRRQIGVVLQKGRLVAGDILTNIIGSSSATLEEAWEAARRAGFADDVKAMPMGMHTVISEGGGTLSGGQRQRLMIARAIVSQPRVLLFDEATSALDNRTQAIVSSSLERLQATRIVVAHRLSTIVNADRIYVIERGRIVQAGRYDELMREKGTFAELARRQLA